MITVSLMLFITISAFTIGLVSGIFVKVQLVKSKAKKIENSKYLFWEE